MYSASIHFQAMVVRGCGLSEIDCFDNVLACLLWPSLLWSQRDIHQQSVVICLSDNACRLLSLVKGKTVIGRSVANIDRKDADF